MFLLVTLASVICLAYSSPLIRRSTPRWTRPCGSFEIQMPNPLPLPPLNETLGEIVALTQSGVDYSRQLRVKYRLQRVLSNDMASVLDNVHLDGFPLKKSSDEAINDADSDTVTALKKDYTTLSKLAVWLEQMHLDEVTRHQSQFINEVSRVEENVYSMLCKIDVCLRNLNSTVDAHVTRSVMPDKFRRMTIAQTYQRDYIINKDTSEFVDSLEIQYSAMEARYMSRALQ
ncbi:uncharacterized protein LOC121384604 [Gigantopelta aegis]|uniref:uncharacterized protein LOC121384604 n=1 Tax=Gigantopelta aegis TaxID=1735272 RepID=UPI001B88AF5D|nr:uncharacterized protein LOC121384604 [Gigantopelta aegis]